MCYTILMKITKFEPTSTGLCRITPDEGAIFYIRKEYIPNIDFDSIYAGAEFNEEQTSELLDAGIDSLKIEGRMKTALYVATVARTYRKAIDDLLESKEKYEANMSWYHREIRQCTYREFSTGFYFGKPNEQSQIYDANTYVSESVYLGCVEALDDRGFARIEQKNKFCVGDSIEIMKPNGENITTDVVEIWTSDGETRQSAPHPQEVLFLNLSIKPEIGDLLRASERK